MENSNNNDSESFWASLRIIVQPSEVYDAGWRLEAWGSIPEVSLSKSAGSNYVDICIFGHPSMVCVDFPLVFPFGVHISLRFPSLA